MAIPLLG